jgi:hypothetical protein
VANIVGRIEGCQHWDKSTLDCHEANIRDRLYEGIVTLIITKNRVNSVCGLVFKRTREKIFAFNEWTLAGCHLMLAFGPRVG